MRVIIHNSPLRWINPILIFPCPARSRLPAAAAATVGKQNAQPVLDRLPQDVAAVPRADPRAVRNHPPEAAGRPCRGRFRNDDDSLLPRSVPGRVPPRDPLGRPRYGAGPPGQRQQQQSGLSQRLQELSGAHVRRSETVRHGAAGTVQLARVLRQCRVRAAARPARRGRGAAEARGGGRICAELPAGAATHELLRKLQAVQPSARQTVRRPVPECDAVRTTPLHNSAFGFLLSRAVKDGKLIQQCLRYFVVRRGCLIEFVGALNKGWSTLTEAIVPLIGTVRSVDGIETDIKSLDGKLSNAIMHAMQNGPQLEKQVRGAHRHAHAVRWDDSVAMQFVPVGRTHFRRKQYRLGLILEPSSHAAWGGFALGLDLNWRLNSLDYDCKPPGCISSVSACERCEVNEFALMKSIHGKLPLVR